MQLNPTLTYLPTILLCLVRFVGMANSWFVIIKTQVKYGFDSSVECGYALYCLHPEYFYENYGPTENLIFQIRAQTFT